MRLHASSPSMASMSGISIHMVLWVIGKLVPPAVSACEGDGRDIGEGRWGAAWNRARGWYDFAEQAATCHLRCSRALGAAVVARFAAGILLPPSGVIDVSGQARGSLGARARLAMLLPVCPAVVTADTVRRGAPTGIADVGPLGGGPESVEDVGEEILDEGVHAWQGSE